MELFINLIVVRGWSAQIRRAWDDQKTTKQNFADMGLFVGQKGILPIKTKKASFIFHFLPCFVFAHLLPYYSQAVCVSLMLQNMEEEEQQPVDSNVPLKPYVIKGKFKFCYINSIFTTPL